MKNEKKHMGFLIIKIWQILKHFSRALCSKLCANLLFLKRFWKFTTSHYCEIALIVVVLIEDPCTALELEYI